MPQVPNEPRKVDFEPGKVVIPDSSFNTLPDTADEQTVLNPRTSTAATIGNLAASPAVLRIETWGSAELQDTDGNVEIWGLQPAKDESELLPIAGIRVPHQSEPLPFDLPPTFALPGEVLQPKMVIALSPPEAGSKARPGAVLHLIDRGPGASTTIEGETVGRFLVATGKAVDQQTQGRSQDRTPWKNLLGKEVWSFHPGQDVTFGRKGRRDGSIQPPEPGVIRIPGASVSEYHAKLEFTDDATTVTNVSKTQWTDVTVCQRMQQPPK